MNIFIKKFGDVLLSRQAGREAYLAFSPTLKSLKDGESLAIDFEGVNTFSPSWGDEFLTPIQKQYGDKLVFRNATNPSVALTLATLKKVRDF